MESTEKKDFYFEFEKKYRGSRELIKERLRVYIPFVQKCKTIHTDCKVFDIGCGRGEWLELLSENEILAHGCDLDDDMIDSCKERGFSVEKNDALNALKSLENESISIVSGFHIAEHLPFEILLEIIRQAKRVLKPAGLLILETPNPENLVTGSCNFYTDPSHNHPLPPNLLSFLAEYNDFNRVKILRLQEDKNLHSATSISLHHAITGVSPDYSIIAQKAAEKEILAEFDELFNQNYGLTLEHLCNTYDKTIRNELAEQRKKIEELTALIQNTRHRTLYGACEWLYRKIFPKNRR